MVLFPQIQMIALCNSRAMGEENTNSDIDLFIIAKKGNLWTARFIVTAITSIFGVRRRNTHRLQKGTPEYIRRTKDKFCLSFFITEEAMNFSSIRLQPDDPYMNNWIRTLSPLVNKHNTYNRFMEANNLQIQSTKYKVHNEGFFDILSFVFCLLSLLEEVIKYIWLPRTMKTYEMLGKPWWVVISDTMLKFHDNDQRKVYRERYFR
jgi:predicted nucleotidyltransferase